ncbi:MAG TPA: hypothetical protein VF796_11455 [Humisphaera sp.]
MPTAANGSPADPATAGHVGGDARSPHDAVPGGRQRADGYQVVCAAGVLKDY